MKQAVKTLSLQDTMNDMARRMDALLDDHRRSNPGDIASQDLRFWIAVDPVLADLHKLLVDAKAQRGRIASRHGNHDPMLDIACDMVDSAACAVETRLIELRQSDETRAAVAAIMQKALADKEEEQAEAERERSKRFWKDFAAQRDTSASKQADGSLWMVLASLMLLRHNLDHADRMLSIAAIFDRAAVNDDIAFNRRRAAI